MNLDHLPFPTYGWGYMPPQEDIYDIFRTCQELHQPKHVLEIGFHLGHSTTYQLECYPDAALVSISPDNEMVKARIPEDVIDPELRRFMARRIAKLYPDRFQWIPGKTYQLIERLLAEYAGKFDFCLLDGNHKEEHALTDFKACFDLGIPNVLVDNFDQEQVLRAFKKSRQYELVQEFDYTQTFKGKTSNNKMGLIRLTSL